MSEGGPSEDPFITELRPDLDSAVDRLLERMELGDRSANLENELQALLEKYPDYHMTNFALGTYLSVVAKDPVGAIPFFEKAVRIFPVFAEGHYNLGCSHTNSGHIAQAVAAYRQAIRYSEKGGIIHHQAKERLRGLEGIVLKNSPFASLDAYIESEKLFERGFENLSNQRYETAKELFEQVLKVNPQHVQSYGNLALVEAGLGHKAAALECIEKALALDPSYEPAMTNRKFIEDMTEGVPAAPRIFAETEYYAERLREKKSPGRSWWQNIKMWRTGKTGENKTFDPGAP